MNKQILKLAIPNIVSNLSVPLLGAVDTAVVGRLDHVYYLGAIAVGSIIFDFIFWGFGFLRMGTTGLVAQAYGADNEEEARIILYRVLLVGMGLSAAILLLQIPIINFALMMVDASPEVEEFARSYYHIRIFAAPATLALFGLNGWFLGMQNSHFPMIVTITLNALNIVLNLVFVLLYNMNVSGVALGSLIASYSAAGVALLLYFWKYHPKEYHKISLIKLLDPGELQKFFEVNRDIFIRTICLIFSYAFFVAKSAEMGDTVLAANTILIQLWHISAYGVDGFAFAAESLVGKYTGAGDKVGLRKAIRYSLIWGLLLGLIGTGVYALWGDQILLVFTDKEAVLQAISVVFLWTIAAPIINSICFIWDGVYIGATSTAAMRNSMLIATLIFFTPVYFIFRDIVGIHAVWLAMTVFMVSRGITLTLFAPRHIYQVSNQKITE